MKSKAITMTKDGRFVTTESKYSEKLRLKTVESVRYVMDDAADAIVANPNGTNVRYYVAEVRLCLAELVRRLQRRSTMFRPPVTF